MKFNLNLTLVAALVVAALLVGAVSIWQAHSADHGEAPTIAAGESRAGMPGTGLFAASRADTGDRFVTGLEQLPASLAGTDVNGALMVDADGHLIVDGAVRELFDYFLTTVGEEPLATVAARLRAYIAHRLAEPARAEALALLDSYLQFWQAAGDLSRSAQAAPGSDTPAAMAAYLAQLRDLRSRYFSREVVQAFFANDDIYQDYALARVQVLQDPSLDAVQRAARLGELLAALPADTQEALRTATVIQTLDEVTGSCRKSGCSAAEVQRIRTELVGPEAAQRLADLDREEAALQAKLAGYFVQRDRIATNPAYSEPDRQAQIVQLQTQLFSADEQLRLAALERIHDDRLAAAP